MKTLISKIGLILLIQILASSLFAHVELDYPTGGETLVTGSTVTIEWHIAIPHNTLNWDVLFSPDGGATWEFIQIDLPAGTLSYQWVVPSTPTTQARVSVIQDNDGMDYQDESMDFTIQAPPMLPFIVLGAIDTMIESNIEQYDAIQTWLDNHGGASATGFCGELVWSDNYSNLSNECGSTGSALVTFTAVDECGSTETTATVTVVDFSPPTLISQANDLLVECNGTGHQAALIPWLVAHGGAVAQDNGGNIIWSNDYAALNDSCGLTGNTTVIFTATDECGNYSTTYATFTIEDQTSPVISTAAQDTVIECGLPNTQPVLQHWLNRHGGAIANDICGSVTWTNDFPVVVDTCHAFTNVSVTFTALDECGNSDSTTATVTLMGSSGLFPANNATFDFTLSPNPVSHTLRITFDQQVLQKTNITLFNAYGNLLLTIEEVSGEVSIPVYDYAPGVYLVQAKTSNGLSTRKVIIE